MCVVRLVLVLVVRVCSASRPPTSSLYSCDTSPSTGRELANCEFVGPRLAPAALRSSESARLSSLVGLVPRFRLGLLVILPCWQ